MERENSLFEIQRKIFIRDCWNQVKLLWAIGLWEQDFLAKELDWKFWYLSCFKCNSANNCRNRMSNSLICCLFSGNITCFVLCNTPCLNSCFNMFMLKKSSRNLLNQNWKHSFFWINKLERQGKYFDNWIMMV